MRKLIIALFGITVALGTGCVPGESPIRITGFFSVDTGTGGAECNLDNEVGQTRGFLDASGGGDYVVVMNIASDVTAEPVLQSARGLDLTGPGSRNFLATEVFLTYRSVNPTITFDPESIPITATFAPNTAENRLAADIIGDKAATRLRDMLSDPTITTILTVNVQLRGRLESGETVHSNSLSFPIEVKPSNAPCTEPGNVARTGPCGARGGQDGTPVICCTGPGMPAGC